MALRFQTIPVPFGQGLAQEAVPSLLAPGKLAQADQGIISKQGSIEVRPGFQDLPQEIFDVDGLGARTLTSIHRVVAHGFETLVSDVYHLYSYSEGEEQWRQVDHAYEATVADRIKGERGRDVIQAEGDVTYCGGYYIHTWYHVDDGEIHVRFTDAATGTRFPDSVISTTSYRHRVIKAGTLVHVFFLDDGAGEIAVETFDATNLETPSVTSWVGGDAAADGIFDAYATSTRIYLAYNRDVAATLTIRIVKMELDLTILNTADVTAQSSRHIAVCAVTGQTIFVAYTELPAAGTPGLKYFAWDDNLWVGAVVPTQVDSDIYDTGTAVRALGIVVHASTTALIVYELRGAAAIFPSRIPQLRARWVNSTGTAGDGNQTYRIGLLSKPIVHNGSIYAVGYYHERSHQNLTYHEAPGWPNRYAYLLQFPTAAVEPMESSWTADAQCRVVSRLATFYTGYPTTDQISNLAEISTDKFICSVPVKSSTLDETGVLPYAVPVDEGFDLYTLEFGEARTHLATAIQGEALFSGGVPALYDGERLSEYGFHYGPLLHGTGQLGAMEAVTIGDLSGTYQWVAIYTWLDSQGVRHRSWRSNVVGLTVVDKQVSFLAWNLSLTEHEDSANESQPVMIEIYRAGGTSDGFFHLDQVVENDRTSPYQTVTSTISDTDIQSREILYTEGGVLEDTTAPACRHIVANGDRVWLVSADDPEFLWISKINGRDNVIPGWALDFVSRTEIGEGCTGLASLDDKLIAFKADQVWAYVGDPPNDQGVGGSLNGPNLVSVQTGCVDARSIGLCPAGVVFRSRESIHVFTRGNTVEKIGGPVEDALDLYPVVTSAVHNEALELVLFTLTDGTNGVTLAWHYVINEWTIWHINDTRSTADAPGVSGAMCRRGGDLEYHQAQVDGIVLHCDPDQYTEHDGVQPSLVLTTPWFQFANVQGFQMVRRLTFLGTYRSIHRLDFKVFYDFDDSVYDTCSLTSAEVVALLKNKREQVSLHLGAKCQAIRVEITATTDGLGTGRDVRWESLLLELGGKAGTFRLPVEARR